MPRLVDCSCGKKLKLPDDSGRRKFRCPNCGGIVETSEEDRMVPPLEAVAPPGPGAGQRRSLLAAPGKGPSGVSPGEPFVRVGRGRAPVARRQGKTAGPRPEVVKPLIWPWVVGGVAAFVLMGLGVCVAGVFLLFYPTTTTSPSPVVASPVVAVARPMPPREVAPPPAPVQDPAPVVPARPAPAAIAPLPDPTKDEPPLVAVALPPPEWLKQPAPDWFPQDDKKRDLLRQARRDWAKRTNSAAYDKLAPKDGKGDAAARRAMASADRKSAASFHDLNSEVEMAIAAREAVEDGCTDPLIAYLRVRWSAHSEPMTPEDRNPLFVQTAWAIHASKYPAVRRAHPLANAAMAVKAAPDSIPEARKEIRRLLDACCALLPTILKDPNPTAQEEALGLCTPLVAGYMFLKGDRQDAFRTIDAVLEKGKAPKAFRLLLEGKVSINYAWDARGNGVASTVTPEDWKLFKERLETAETTLEEAWKLDPTSPLAAGAMITVALGLGYPREQMEVWFRRALQADPDNQAACLHKLLYLQPKWHGSAEEMLEFARECVRTKNTAAEFTLLLPFAHRTLSRYQRNPLLYYENPIVWQDIHPAYEMDLKERPDCRVIRSMYAKEAYDCAQVLVAHKQFLLLGDRPYLPQFTDEADYKHKRDYCITVNRLVEARKAGRP